MALGGKDSGAHGEVDEQVSWLGGGRTATWFSRRSRTTEEEDGSIREEAELLAPLDSVDRTMTLWQISGTARRGDAVAVAATTASGGDGGVRSREQKALQRQG